MKKYITLVSVSALALLLMLQTACSGSSNTPVSKPPASTSTGNPTVSQTSNPTPAPNQPVSTPPAGTQNPSTAAAPTSASPSAQLSLTVTSPADESVVGTNNVVINGQTAADAAVSVNGDFIDVDANGKFSVPVTLDEGPNVFDIIATDDSGDQASTEIVVSYAPQA